MTPLVTFEKDNIEINPYYHGIEIEFTDDQGTRREAAILDEDELDELIQVLKNIRGIE